MQDLRVVDLARTMGITSKELIFKLRSIGVSVTSDEDTLDLSTVRSIITGETLQRRPREVIVRSEARQEETTTSTARDRMAKRRRRQVVETEKEILEFAPESFDDEAEDVEDGVPAEAAETPPIEIEIEAEETADVAEADAEEPNGEGRRRCRRGCRRG